LCPAEYLELPVAVAEFGFAFVVVYRPFLFAFGLLSVEGQTCFDLVEGLMELRTIFDLAEYLELKVWVAALTAAGIGSVGFVVSTAQLVPVVFVVFETEIAAGFAAVAVEFGDVAVPVAVVEFGFAFVVVYRPFLFAFGLLSVEGQTCFDLVESENQVDLNLFDF